MQVIQRRVSIACTSACVGFVALVSWPMRASAGGFSTPTFDAEHSTAADVQPSSLYYNPGAIGLLDGQQLMVDAALVVRTAGYTRSASAIDPSTLSAVEDAGMSRQAGIDALAGHASLTNLIALPFAGLVSDLGLRHSPLRMGAAFFVPFGGQATFDRQREDPAFPGASDGPARWYTMEGTIRSLAVSLAAAYRWQAARLSVGISGTLYFSQVNTIRARNANATDNLITSDGALVEGRSLLDVSGTHFGLGAGVIWEAVPKRLWLGASYQSQPGFGTMRLTGTLSNTLGTAPPAPPADVVFTEALPDIIRLGARWSPRNELELRLGLNWERWSRLEQMCLAEARVSDMTAACKTHADGSLVNTQYTSDVVQVFSRGWHDTLGVRLGASYFVGSAWELFAGASFDSNAIPSQTLDPALYDMAKISFALGAAYKPLAWLKLMLTVTDWVYFQRDTRGVAGNETLAPPSRQPSNAGLYTQNLFIVQPAAALAF